MPIAVTTDGLHYINPSYYSTFGSAVLAIATGGTLTTNLQNFLNVDSAASNDVWGGVKRADIRNYGAVTSADALEWQRCTLQSLNAGVSTSPANVSLVMDELYSAWISNEIGYFGDSVSSPLFRQNKVIDTQTVTVGTVLSTGSGYYASTSSGSISDGTSDAFNGDYIEGIYWYSNSLYLVIDGLHENAGWESIVINGLTFTRDGATYSQDGYEAYSHSDQITIWQMSAPTNPFPSVGSNATVTINSWLLVGATGAVSLNDIHIDAGGVNTGSASINDLDIRALNWYQSYAGGTVASGATQRFSEFYYPTQTKSGIYNYKPYIVGDSNSFCIYQNTTSIDDPEATGGGRVEFVTYHNGTNTYIMVKSVGDSATIYTPSGGSSSATSNTFYTIYSIPNFVPDSVNLYSQIVSTDGVGDVWVDSAPLTSGVTYLSANNTTTFVNMSTNQYYGRMAESEVNAGCAEVLTEDFRASFTFNFRKLPTSSGTRIDRTVRFMCRIRATADASACQE